RLNGFAARHREAVAAGGAADPLALQAGLAFEPLLALRAGNHIHRHDTPRRTLLLQWATTSTDYTIKPPPSATACAPAGWAKRIGCQPARVHVVMANVATDAADPTSPVTDRVLVGLATYKERDNLAPLIREIHAFAPHVHVLVIDDNSPDGTGQLADELAAAD